VVEVTQTRFIPRGDCYAACIASILELDIERLPHLPEDDDIVLAKFPIMNPEHFGVKDARTSYWHDMWATWFRDNNLMHMSIRSVKLDEWDRRVLDVWHIINGPSPRDPEQTERNGGHKHSVVGRKGLIRFDPHPSRAGLLACDSYELIIPANIEKPILEEYRRTIK
jgi:hypothetical protein